MGSVVSEMVQHIIDNPKTAPVIAAGTTIAGAGAFLDIVSDIFGLVGVLIGITLSLASLKNALLERKKKRLEIAVLEKKLKQR